LAREERVKKRGDKRKEEGGTNPKTMGGVSSRYKRRKR